MKFRKVTAASLHLGDWEIEPGQSLCVYGGNASGKSLLAELCAGVRNPESGTIEGARPSVAFLSFESQQADYERELQNDDSDFLDRMDFGSTGREILESSGADPAAIDAAAEKHGLSALLLRGCRQYSSGELRRIYLLKELLQNPDLLVLDEPYEGMDARSRAQIESLLRKRLAAGQVLYLFVNRHDDIPDFIPSLALLARGQIVAHGERSKILATPEARQLISLDRRAAPELPPPIETQAPAPIPLLRMRALTVAYPESILFANFDWELEPGQHTLITGPNGCGKSTLLTLITGDHPQCYVNDLHLFGYQRGSGESIWDIKRQLGIVSPSLHRDYRAGGNTTSVVLSGFFDSIGLYDTPSTAQRQAARQWLDVLGLAPCADQPFRSLSYGQQRLALIARALVKQPPLVILDEPTQGLDDLNRHLVLASLERLAQLQRSTLLFVSHRQDEHLALFRSQLRFEPQTGGGARYCIRKLDAHPA